MPLEWPRAPPRAPQNDFRHPGALSFFEASRRLPIHPEGDLSDLRSPSPKYVPQKDDCADELSEIPNAIAPGADGVNAPREAVHFPFTIYALLARCSDSSGYGDKRCRAIDAADPGAVPGGSTKSFASLRGGKDFDGAELGSTCVEKRYFCPAWISRKMVQNLKCKR
jgi:hypothetical protein